MNHQRIIEKLSAHVDLFKALFNNVSNVQARWKPGRDRWSLLEVINHLYDEEREDFRLRLQLVLDDPGKAWPPIDPEAWVVQRRYNEQDVSASLKNFFQERDNSLAWLKKLNAPDWQAAHRHPRMGPLSAELILANWLAHDLFHVRQATDLHVAWLSKQIDPVPLDYSGWE